MIHSLIDPVSVWLPGSPVDSQRLMCRSAITSR
jgi:hypothetical protein